MEKVFLLVLVLWTDAGLSFQSNEHQDDHTSISLGPYENSTDPDIDEGHKILLHVAKTVPGFKEELGYNWTGKELLCNCTSSSCGSRSVIELLAKAGLKNVCVGLACYHQKRVKKTGKHEAKDEHWGCFGGDRQEHDVHLLHEPMLCANTSDINVKCCTKSFCHQSIEQFPWPGETGETKGTYSSYILIFVVAGIFIFPLIVLIVWGILRRRKKENTFADGIPLMDNNPSAPVYPENVTSSNYNETTSTYCTDTLGNGGTANGNLENVKTNGGHALQHLMKDLDPDPTSTTVGEGVQLTRATYTSNMTKRECIGKGRFGEVYKCELRGQFVAAKLISNYNEKSFNRELAMYTNGSIRHTNILQFLGDDFFEGDNVSTRCLLFEYHELGSLDKFLSKQTVGVETATRMIFSMATGLAFLHNVHESSNKVQSAIAHRDLKSGNVLVKNNLMLCISDLGLAVCLIGGKIGVPGDNDITPKELGEKCGTMRYLPPELLREKMDMDVFEAFRAADIYSMSLVMYEICRRTEIEDQRVTPYEEALPYFRQIKEAGGVVGVVDNALMSQIVVDHRERPDLTPWWQHNPAMKGLEKLMQNCWLEEPMTRLTAANVIHSLRKIANQQKIDLSQT